MGNVTQREASVVPKKFASGSTTNISGDTKCRKCKRKHNMYHCAGCAKDVRFDTGENRWFTSLMVSNGLLSWGATYLCWPYYGYKAVGYGLAGFVVVALLLWLTKRSRAMCRCLL